ncbi:class E sortase [Yinghuangia sp. ASG 101]|uniref:class E sortase n=1 Tax=Yinghuangia sp. ASG 101 TaxID=2896848 RepID=UPI001E4D86D0|nr:class E sortase [Yinghuangia sp. ASG 101]UGQ15255.1 class E sortase [Yinghuangia sp. ASG 101]
MRTALRGLGEAFITLGFLILLFVVYQLYWTGVLARQARADELDKLEAQMKQNLAAAAPPVTTPAADPPSPAAPEPAPQPPYEPGKSFAVMYIPRFGGDWKWTVLAGTSTNTLKKGLGWYEGSAQAGQDGNFAIAGHRKTYGDPMIDFPKLRVGDKVVVNDTVNWYVYSLDKPLVNGTSDKAVYKTLPDDVGVVATVPAKAFDRPGKYITLTTCDPEWGSSHRLIAWGHLESVQPLSAGEPEALKGAS